MMQILSAPPATVHCRPGWTCSDGCQHEQAAVRWSGASADPPAIGETVRMTGFGSGTVRGYSVEHGWLALRVRLSDPPEWYVEQNGYTCLACMFGAEVVLGGQ